MSALAKISSLLYNRKSFLRGKIVKLPGSLKDKLCAALGLGLVCGLALPLEPVEAKDSKDSKDSKAKAEKKAQAKPEKPAAKDKPKPQEPELQAKQTPQEPQPSKDPCPACGRG
jgi:hemolysin activation/secretion protein